MPLPQGPFETGRLFTPRVDRYGRIPVRTHRHSVPIRLIGKRVRVVLHASSWIRIPRFDYTLSGRLRFVLSGGQHHRAGERADTPDHPLEDQLADIAQEVTLRGDAAERRHGHAAGADPNRIRGMDRLGGSHRRAPRPG